MFFYALKTQLCFYNDTNMGVDLFGFTIFMIFGSKIKMRVHDSIKIW